jgi:hypothetical protein
MCEIPQQILENKSNIINEKWNKSTLMVRDGVFWAEETDTSFSQRFVLQNQPVFHVLYFTIVEAMFALDGSLI